MSILDFWPFKNSPPRQTQIDVLNWVESLPHDKKYIICEVPVGGGKSPIALTISGWLNGPIGYSFILTPQKILQKQYEDSFPDKAFGFYGKSNYECSLKGTNCEIGDLIKPRCAGTSCPHKRAYESALESSNLIMNYSLAITYKLTPADLMKRRSLIVFDECHNLEKQLIDIFGVFISEKACRKYLCKYKKPKNLVEGFAFIRDDYKPAIVSYIANRQIHVDEITNNMRNGQQISKDDTMAIDELDKTKKHLLMINFLLDKKEEDFVNDHVLIEHAESFEIKELYAKNIFSNFFNNVADKFLFMSSTILDKDEFCHDLGIPLDQVAFISTQSEFDVENRQVIFKPCAKMTYGWESREADKNKMLTSIKTICSELHGDHHGVIHTGSYQVAMWLVKALQGNIPHKIYHHNSDAEMKREHVINEFQSDGYKGPKILISPSVTEGLDLKDDLGRFCIIAKTPYPYLGDAWVKRRAEISQKWYMLQAMKTIIQSSGRVVRSKSDWGVTYILDDSFTALYNRMKMYTPLWWVDSLVYM